jgi:hypothetical protein
VFGALNEAQKRWFVGREALLLGRGGIAKMCQASGLSKPTVLKGMREVKSGDWPAGPGRVRREGAGRKRVEESCPRAVALLEDIMEESTAGDPMSLLKWTSKSSYQIRDELQRRGCAISEDTVQRLLQERHYSLQGNRKEKEGRPVPERDAQFRYLNGLAREYLERGEPVISVDAKKKEKVGNFKNSGRKWRKTGEAPEVNVYDYESLAEGKAIPYGAYDVGRNEGMVNVGVSHNTPEFAVESLRQWWRQMGRRRYGQARRLLICADAGGSNSPRQRAWKYYLQAWSRESGLEITVCHYPPGTSKWNKIEHRMFSFISLNWRGEPLVSYETVVEFIAQTRTRKGLKVEARLDKREYEEGKEITDEQMEGVNLYPHKERPLWNYTIKPG